MKFIFGVATVVFLGLSMKAFGGSILNIGVTSPLVLEGVFNLLLATISAAFTFQKRF